MALKTNTEWLEWGRRDPLFAVSSWKDKAVDGSAPWTDDEFYSVGRSDWQEFDGHWRRYGCTKGTFLEIGCGAGRITRQLSLSFANGHALDISKEMITYAKSHVPASNVTWHVTTGTAIPLEDKAVDAVFSCHVLQHLPSPLIGYAYFREAYRTLKSGGSLMVHVPMHNFPLAVSHKFSRACDFIYRRLLTPVLNAKSEYQRSRMNAGGRPPMHGISFDQYELHKELIEIGFEQVEFSIFPVRSTGMLHAFVFATRPPQ